MNKFIASLSGLLLYFTIHTQTCQGPPVLSESFNSGIPNNWTILDFDTCSMFFNMPLKGYTGHWQAYEHYGRKCVANCGRFTTNCTANDYLVTPQITLGSTPVCLSWKGSTMYSSYIENYEIRISTTTPDSTGMKAHPALAVINNDLPAWADHYLDLSPYAGQTVYIGFWYNTTNQYAIYIDDIRISEPVSLDATVSSVDFPDVILPGSQVISGQLLNGGLSPINSFNLNWKVGSGPVNSMSVTSTIAPSSTYNFTHSINWVPSLIGTYLVKVWASNLNGGNDMYPANDTLTETVFVNTFPRKVLIEEFTQASCPPCASQNPAFDAIVQPNITTGKISSIQYHTVWPGIDPMNAFNKGAVAERVLYYGIGGVPSAIMGGVFVPNSCNVYTGAPACLTQNQIDSATAEPTIFDIGITEAKTPSVFTATVTVTAKTDIPFTSFNLYIVIVEDTIVYSSPPGTNGETIFYQVARKMFPDSTGHLLNPMALNQSVSFVYSYPVDTATCKMPEIRTVAFISDDATRHVYQSAHTLWHTTGLQNHKDASNINIFPNPFEDVVTIQYVHNTNTTLSCKLYDVSGRLVVDQKIKALDGKNETVLNLSHLSKGAYLIKIEDMKSGLSKTARIIK